MASVSITRAVGLPGRCGGQKSSQLPVMTQPRTLKPGSVRWVLPSGSPIGQCDSGWKGSWDRKLQRRRTSRSQRSRTPAELTMNRLGNAAAVSAATAGPAKATRATKAVNPTMGTWAPPRTVYVKASPAPLTFAERRAVLHALKRHCKVDYFQKIPVSCRLRIQWRSRRL